MTGVCIWLTGLPCSGKTTIAQLSAAAIRSAGKTVTVLDADVVRPVLCPDLGFSPEDRCASLMRIAFVAREIVIHRGVVITATVSPFHEHRLRIRHEFDGLAFAQVFVDAPISTCENRDVKGMYAKARRMELDHFTGISSPYERPEDSELICDTCVKTPEACAQEVVDLVARLVGPS